MVLCSRNGSTSGLDAAAAPNTNMSRLAMTLAVMADSDGGGDDADECGAECDGVGAIADDADDDDDEDVGDWNPDEIGLSFAPWLAANSTMRPDNNADGMRCEAERGVSADRGDETNGDEAVGLANAARSNDDC
jgi:hypothetical protein